MKALFIIGPSGSGKTTLSNALTQIYKQTFGASTVTLVSLDPANYLSQHKDIEINQLVTVQDIMQQYELGPNGAILYAMDFLLQNIEWLQSKIKAILNVVKNKADKECSHLFIFDLPGQIQLYINSQSMKNIIKRITALISQKSGTNACLLQLFDCTYMGNVNQFISLCMMSLSTMINLQMPHINVLNKIDIIKSSQTKPSRGLINEYFRVNSAAELVQELKPYQDEDKTTDADIIAKIIDTYGQVSFMPCSISNPDLICNLIYELERVFGTLQISLYLPKFMQLVKEVDDFSMERAITQIQNQYYEEEEQNLEKFQQDIQKQM